MFGRQGVAGAGTPGGLTPVLHLCGCAFYSLSFCGMDLRDVTFFHMMRKFNWFSLPLEIYLNKACNQDLKHTFLNQIWETFHLFKLEIYINIKHSWQFKNTFFFKYPNMKQPLLLEILYQNFFCIFKQFSFFIMYATNIYWILSKCWTLCNILGLQHGYHPKITVLIFGEHYFSYR